MKYLRKLPRDFCKREREIYPTPIVVEVLSGIRDPQEYLAWEPDFRALPCVPTDGEAADNVARLGKALAAKGKTGTTVDLMMAGAAIHADAELWSLLDDHYEDIRQLVKRGDVKVPRTFRLRWLPYNAEESSLGGCDVALLRHEATQHPTGCDDWTAV